MMDQRSDEWFSARLGKATASKISDIIAKTKSGYSTSRANYAAQLITERLTGQKGEAFMNGAMQWGVDNEEGARLAYMFRQDCDVSEVGFIDHPSVDMSGASPDGLVGLDGLVEIKCPMSATHIDTLLEGKVPAKYITQMQWQMACTDRKWCDFVSYDPRLPEAMRVFISRVNRDDAFIRDLESEVATFLAEVSGRVEKLTEKYK